MKSLVLDFGNTAVKIAVFDYGNMLNIFSVENFSVPLIEEYIKDYKGIKNCIFSTVIELENSVIAWLNQNFDCIELTHLTKVPLKNKYLTPETLGKDRLSAAVGAHLLFPGQNVLSIDAGTALKFDFVNKEGEYLGGSISPGLKIRFLALHTFTDKLPLVSWQEYKNVIGRNTTESILSGVFLGMLAEIDGMIDAYLLKYPDLKVILTGGEAIYFEKLLKNSIFAVPNLVIIGLYEILKFNEEKL